MAYPFPFHQIILVDIYFVTSLKVIIFIEGKLIGNGSIISIIVKVMQHLYVDLINCNKLTDVKTGPV